VLIVEPGSPAAKAGVRAAVVDKDGKLEALGDIILKVEGKVIKDRFEVVQEIAKRRPGQTASLTIWRNKQPVQIKVAIVARNR
jgi:serine protease Do